MDSSDEEILNDAANQWELSLLNQDVQTAIDNKCDSDDGDSPSSEYLQVLSQKFGHRKFRKLQWKIIKSILEDKRDNLAIMSTGYGKSLCYQYPAVFSNGTTVVISPLISLMQDQVLSLSIANIPACLLGTAQERSSSIKDEIFNGKYSVVYLTPEYCTGDVGLEFLKNMSERVTITLIAVDEAHTVSTWGHDFRSSYLKLHILKAIFPSVPILAVTATATEKIKNDIVSVLKMKNPQVLCSGFDRPNLYLCAKPKGLDIVGDLKTLMTLRDGHFTFDGPTIIYCVTRKDTDFICGLLNCHNIKALSYHAGMSLENRKKAHERFVKDEVSVIVATVAFGMGIDKPDIRNVIHYGSAHSVEIYYQEIGRAGRDGLPAKCVIFYASKDFATISFLIDKNRNSNKERNFTLLEAMKEYLFSVKCRREFILSYFEEKPVPLDYRKDCCDNCAGKQASKSVAYEGLNEEGLYDYTDDAVKYLNAVDEMGGRFGHSHYILFLRGSKSSKLRPRYRDGAFYGKGADKSEIWWKAIANFLELKKYLTKQTNNCGQFTYFTFSCSSLAKDFLSQTNRKLLDQPTAEVLGLLKNKIGVTAGGARTRTSAVRTVNVAVKDPAEKRESVAAEKQESAQETEARLKLFRLLKNCRSQLAIAYNCMPYMVSSDYVLMKLAIWKPKTMEELRSLPIDGLTEARIDKFGEQFLKVVANIVPRSDNAESSESKKPSILSILKEHPLEDVTMTLSESLTRASRKNSGSIKDIATIKALQCGHPIKLEDLGVSPKARAIIVQVINNLGGNYSLLTSVKQACPEGISDNQIIAVCTYLKVRDHLRKLGIPYEEFEDFVYNEKEIDKNLKFEDGNDDLLSAFCDEVEKQANTQDIMDDTDAIDGNDDLLSAFCDEVEKQANTQDIMDDTDAIDGNDDLLSAFCDEVEKRAELADTRDILDDTDAIDELLINKPSTSLGCDSPPAKKIKHDDFLIIDSSLKKWRKKTLRILLQRVDIHSWT